VKYWRTIGISLALIAAGGGIWAGTVASKGLFEATTSQPEETLLAQAGTPPQPTVSSGAAELGLAKHLRQIGAKMYGAYWCPHCHEQIEVFGKEAAQLLPYIECAEDGKNAQVNLCRKAGIRGFPTWTIKGKTYEGTQSLEDLAQASGYRGASNFKNSSR
jgi:hypothetical protein